MKLFFKRLIIFIVVILFIPISVTLLITSIPIWLLTGKEILKSTCDSLLTKLIDFYEK